MTILSSQPVISQDNVYSVWINGTFFEGQKQVSFRTDVAHIYCRNYTRTCDVNMYAALHHLSSGSYQVSLEFGSDIFTAQIIESTSFIVETANAGYTLYAIIVRAVFFVLSVIGLIVFWVRTRGATNPGVKFENQQILIMSVCLIFFNDPFYALTMVIPHIAMEVFSVLFVTNFYRQLLLSWAFIWWKIKLGPDVPLTRKGIIYGVLVSSLFFSCLTTQGLIIDIYGWFSPGIGGANEWPN